MAVLTPYQHIELDDNQIPMISGSSMKVAELVLDHLAYGWSPEELQYQHPYLTMGEIHSALAYYWDHQRELDADIEKRMTRVRELQQSTPPSPFVARLRAEKGRQN